MTKVWVHATAAAQAKLGVVQRLRTSEYSWPADVVNMQLPPNKV
jgi:hypothetical protein